MIGSTDTAPLPVVSLIVAAHDEQEAIAAKVANALALEYPRELLEVIVACDGCADATAERARAAGADLVLELPRGGKVRAQDAAVERARGEIVAFSDANALWEPGALRALVAAFAEERVGYACGQVRFVRDPHSPRGTAATNQEGVYWRYEMAVRGWESRLCSITAGNGAIYATRRASYIVVDPIMGHDLSFPYKMVKRGWRAVYVPGARASEKMVPSIEGERARKRRMMSHTWPIVLRGGMLSPRGYPPGYALMILSHRVLRYATPFLHALALAANVALVAVEEIPPGRQAARGASTWRHSRRSSRCSRPRGSAGCGARERCWYAATTCSPPPRSRSACGTGCATARAPRGRQRRGPGEILPAGEW